MTAPTDTGRLVFLLETVEREGRHLLTTTERLFCNPIDAAWIDALEQDLDLAERLDAFVSRFGRMQDTLGDKLQGGTVLARIYCFNRRIPSRLDNPRTSGYKARQSPAARGLAREPARGHSAIRRHG